jgi:hypothetical protein
MASLAVFEKDKGLNNFSNLGEWWWYWVACFSNFSSSSGDKVSVSESSLWGGLGGFAHDSESEPVPLRPYLGRWPVGGIIELFSKRLCILGRPESLKDTQLSCRWGALWLCTEISYQHIEKRWPLGSVNLISFWLGLF